MTMWLKVINTPLNSALRYPLCSYFYSMCIRTSLLTTCGGHHTWQSPGEVCQLRRIPAACGRLPGSPLCQAPSWIPEDCSTTACRALELCEECHLLPSHVSHSSGPGPRSLRAALLEWRRRKTLQYPLLRWRFLWNHHGYLRSIIDLPFLVESSV